MQNDRFFLHIQNIISNEFLLNKEDIKFDSKFKEDLLFDDIIKFEILIMIEQFFKVKFKETDFLSLKKISDVVVKLRNLV